MSDLKAENVDVQISIQAQAQPPNRPEAESTSNEIDVTLEENIRPSGGSEPPPPPPPVRRASWWQRQMRWSNLLSILLIAGLIVLGYYIWQGEGVFVTVDRNQNPFDASLARQPQDVLQTINISQSEGNQSALILQEDFSTSRGSWSFSPPNQSVLYGQALLLDDNIYTGEAWAQPGLTFDNFVLKVSSRWVGGALSGSYGIRIRKDNDTGQFLALYLHNDGRFTIAEQNRRSLNTIANQYNAAIQTDGGINEIQIEASGNVVHFFVNEAYLGTFSDSLPPSGGIEFVAIKDEESEVFKAAFDNLTITHNFVEPNIRE